MSQNFPIVCNLTQFLTVNQQELVNDQEAIKLVIGKKLIVTR